MCSVSVFYGEASSRYSFPGDHPFSGRRVDAFWEEVGRRGLTKSSDLKICNPVLASEASLLTFHTKDLVDLVKESSELGVGLLDSGDTPAFRGVFEASAYIVGSTLSGLEMVLKGEVDHAFNPVGGLHHARRGSAAGFCVFNDVAIAVVEAKNRYGLKRILYVDVDAHHGDGVFYSFYDDPEVFIADIHEDGRYLYPGTGFSDEVGEGAAEGTKLPIPLPPGAGDDEFIKAFDRVEEFVLKAEPQIILFQCGADGLAGDPLTHLRYTAGAHRYAAEHLHTLAHRLCEGRLLAMGGGGYKVENVAAAWVEVLEALLRPVN